MELGEASGAGEDDVMEDRVGEDDEGGFAGLGGFGFAPFAEAGFEVFLGRGVSGCGLFAGGFQGGLGRSAGGFARCA